MEKLSTDEPELWTTSNLYGVWSDTARLVLSGDCAGTWMYKLTAELDNQTLTAISITIAQFPE